MNYITVTLKKHPKRNDVIDVGLTQPVKVVHATSPGFSVNAMRVAWKVQGKEYQRTYLFKIKR